MCRPFLGGASTSLPTAPGTTLSVPSVCLSQAVADLLSELGADGSLHVRLPSWHYADASLAEGAQSLPLSQVGSGLSAGDSLTP